MSSGVNKAILVGYLGKDPDVNQTQHGKSVVNFSIATNESWKDNQGNKQERTEWHRIVVWDKLAEICSRYLRKGSLVCVEGRIETRKWVDKKGIERWTTEVIAKDVRFLGSSNQKSEQKSSSAGGSGMSEWENQQPLSGEIDDLPF